ncbi:MAG: isocitrate/isopropylmalate dehydrogenase family protein [Candidatus Hodarchaeales archaeon]
MRKLTIVTIGGDGIGPEVVKEGLKVLKKIEEIYNLNFEIIPIVGGGKYYSKHGKEWPDGSFSTCKSSDAILLGAVGHPGIRLPDSNIAGAGILLGLRFKLDLFANIRPTKLIDGVPHYISGRFQKIWDAKNVNFTIIRENTEGIYAPIRGQLKRMNQNELAIDNRIITSYGSERIIRFAFEYAKSHKIATPKDGHKRVTAIHKNNLLAGCQLFTTKFYEIAREFSDVKANDILVNAFTQSVLRNPEIFNVCVTTNMMGDILTDLASVLQGGMGMAPSGQINGWYSTSHGLFEPIHGSAPSFAGKNIANPIASILAVSMMLDWLGIKYNSEILKKSSKTIESAVIRVIKEGKALPSDLGGNVSTSETGDAICNHLNISS